jgi:thiol-disulfide isomerase/thioredoxin
MLAAACGRESDARTGDPDGSDDYALDATREAPAFELETLDGDTLSLASLDSVPVILMNFWASWCGPCKIEIPDLMALDETYGPKGFMVLGVTVNDLPRDSRDFAAEVGLSYPSVIGTPRMLEAYAISPWLPSSLLIKDGTIVEEWIGPRPKEEFEYGIQVALGLAPAAADLMADEPAAQDGDGR